MPLIIEIYQICISSSQQLHIVACHVGPLGVLSERLQVFSRPLGFIKGEVSQTCDNLRSELDTQLRLQLSTQVSYLQVHCSFQFLKYKDFYYSVTSLKLSTNHIRRLLNVCAVRMSGSTAPPHLELIFLFQF